jgi:DtxR family Mn-dependent transcriptional regulator
MFGIFRKKGKEFIKESKEILSELIPGQKALINSIDVNCQGIERKRLMDLGFVPGTLVEVAVSSPFRDPTAYKVKGGLIALRRIQASKINISDVQY